MSDHSLTTDATMAVFLDLENLVNGTKRADFPDFDIQLVLERLLLRGHIVVKKAYCDFSRYGSFKRSLHESAFELIEIPHLSQSGKNSADIRMVVDALDLCYTKQHLDTFVILSGDSDFSPLVSKLRENAKQVIGIGVKNSSSDLFINNCDQFIYYDDLVRVKSKVKKAVSPPKAKPKTSNEAPAAPNGPTLQQALEQIAATLLALESESGADDKIWAGHVKQALKRRNPGFNEAAHGFKSFTDLLKEAEKQHLLKLTASSENPGLFSVRSVE